MLSIPVLPIAAAVFVDGDNFTSPITLSGNVIFGSYDKDTVEVMTSGNLIRGNLALGLVKVGVRTRVACRAHPCLWLSVHRQLRGVHLPLREGIA